MKGLCRGTYVHYRQKKNNNSSRWLLITGESVNNNDHYFPLTANWQWKAWRWRNQTEPAKPLCANWRQILGMCESDSGHVYFNLTQRLNFFKRVLLYIVGMWFCKFEVKHFLSMYRLSSCKEQWNIRTSFKAIVFVHFLNHPSKLILKDNWRIFSKTTRLWTDVQSRSESTQMKNEAMSTEQVFFIEDSG